MDTTKTATSDPIEPIIFGNEGDERLIVQPVGDYCQIGTVYPKRGAPAVTWVISKETAEEIALFLLRWTGLL